MAGGLGAILKAAGTIAADTAKDAAASKAKSFITGKGKGKGGALVKAGGQKPTKVDPSNLMGRQVGGDKGGVDIPASRKTINVTAAGSDSPVGSGGGSGDIKIIQDISIAVSAIAESMKSGLVLKEKAKKKAARAAEEQKRDALEDKTEAGKPKKEKKDKGLSFKVPKIGMLDGILGFITNFIFAIAVMKLIEFAPKLKALLPLIKGAGFIVNEIFIKPLGFLLTGLASFIDFGYKIVGGMEKIVTNIFGEEGAEKFRTFMENLKTLINSFLIFKILKGKIGKALVKNIKNAFKLIKGFARRAFVGLKRFLGPGARKGIKGLFQAGKGLFTKGASKVGGFAAKIFGKAAKFVAPALKAATPAVKGFAGRIPILGPIIVGIVSLMSGEPAAQALFKAGGAALGGALGTFIPIPILGTLIGETIGVFVGDLLYELILGGGVEAVGQKLKDTFMTIFKGGQAVANWLGGGIKAFINNVLTTDPIDVKSGLGVRSALTKGLKTFGLYDFFEGLGFAGGKDGQIDKFPNLLNILNPFKFYPLLFKSFFGERDGDEAVTNGGSTTAVVDDEQTTVNGGNADAVATEATYESGEGDAVIIPVPIAQTKTVSTGRRNKRGSGAKTRVVVVDDTELVLYGGK